MNETDPCPNCKHGINWHTPTGCAHADDESPVPYTDCACRATWSPTWCPHSGLGLIDHGQLPTQNPFQGRCLCGAVVTVLDGQITYHRNASTFSATPEQVS